MSITGLSSNPDRLCKNSFRRKNDSGEIDVFEAARYFSEINPGPDDENRPQPGKKSGSRLSLDMPIIISRNSMNPENIALDRKKSKENTKPHKQPSSPGGKLISSFINSIFNQTASKKKKKSKSGLNPEPDQSPGEKRSRRRSSISHFRFTSTNSDSKSSDFYAKTPTKSSYKELFRRFHDFQKPAVFGPGNSENYSEKKRITRLAGLDEKSRLGNGDFGLSGRNINPTATIWGDQEKNNFGKFRAVDDDDDGGDSDSSSDLFDLPINNDEFDFYTSGLPVYGTTHIDRIRIGAIV